MNKKAKRPSSQANTPTIAITGGGTGGHVYPALGVVEKLRDLGGYHIFWIGSKKGMERALVEQEGIAYQPISTGKLRRYLSLQTIPDMFRVVMGIFSSLRVLRKQRPNVLFSKGGFVSVPPVFAAWLLKIPVVSHESDIDPGLATKINMRFSKVLCVPYDGLEFIKSLPPKLRVEVTGNPQRKSLFVGNSEHGRQLLGALLRECEASSEAACSAAYEDSSEAACSAAYEDSRSVAQHADLSENSHAVALNVPGKDSHAVACSPLGETSDAVAQHAASENLLSKPVLLVSGGSLGAQQINKLVAATLGKLVEHFTVVHQMGAQGYQEWCANGTSPKGYLAAPFFHKEYGDILAAAHMVVCRGGAGSLWEVGLLRKPAVVIPLGRATSRGDQVRNAELFAKAGAVITMGDKEVAPEEFLNTILGLLQDSARQEAMRKAASGLCNIDGADKIVALIGEYI